jgi:hypothetical protein
VGLLFEQPICRGIDCLGEIASQAGRANHRKPNSYTEATPDAELRSREYLMEAEVAKLIDAAKGNRYGHRDAAMILVA